MHPKGCIRDFGGIMAIIAPVSGINNFVLNFGGEETGIGEISSSKPRTSVPASWYTLDGRKLNDKPTQKGIYIHNGQKIVIK